MVYTNPYLRSDNLTDKLRARFGERTAGAILRANGRRADAEEQRAPVQSFFGRSGQAGRDRSIPTAKKAERRSPAASRPAAERRAPHAKRQEPRMNPRKSNAARPAAMAQASNPQSGLFSGAYSAGAKVRNITAGVRVPGQKRYTKKNVTKDALRGGRANIPGSRHATLRSDMGADADKSIFARFLDSIRDNRKAEHRVKSSPFPFAYVTLVVVCAIMAMVLIMSHSEVSEYESMIDNLQIKQASLEDTADKLELELEKRDDIRTIENIAVGQIGMVNSDVATTKYITVSAEDRVEILREEEETEGGLSALLSALGEGIGKFSEYFS